MNDKDKSEQASQGKPFTLRPSVLSSTCGPTESSSQRSSSSMLLRPSALTAIADKIESSLPEFRKRKGDSEDKSGDGMNKELSSKKSKGDNNTSQETGYSKLTDSISPPKGIGTFGFISVAAASQFDTISNNSLSETKESHGCIFGERVKDEVKDFQNVSNPDGPITDGCSSSRLSEKEQELKLADNASKHMRKEQSSKIHLTEIEVITGEEGERNVLQMQCKVHLLSHDKSTWIEKGRGILKLNDICKSEKHDIFQSRMVFRRQGSNQVVLNTLLWPEMRYDKGGQKSLRLTAMDAETEKISIFLITGPPKDITQLHTAVDRRVIALKRNRENAPIDTKGSYKHNEQADDSSEAFSNEKVFASDHKDEDQQTKGSTGQNNDSNSSNDSSEHAS